MTRAEISFCGGELEVRLRGHAGESDVCAAASMLICALMERLERLRPELRALHVSSSAGRAEIIARADGKAAELIGEDAELVTCGLELLAAAFPGSVRVKRGDADDEK